MTEQKHTQVNAPSFLNKMSMKTLLGATKKSTIADMLKEGKIKTGHVVVKIVGEVQGTKKGETTFGEYTAFTGTFLARNLINGEEYQSGVLFVDKSATDAIVAKLANINEGDVLEIALQVALQANPDSNVGYNYVTMPLQSASQNKVALMLTKLND